MLFLDQIETNNPELAPLVISWVQLGGSRYQSFENLEDFVKSYLVLQNQKMSAIPEDNTYDWDDSWASYC